MIADANTTENKSNDALISSPGESAIDSPAEHGTESAVQPAPPATRRRRLPGLIAICAYMILLAGVICYGVAQGSVPALFLIFSVFFIAGALGLMMMLRWGWALTLAGVAVMSAFYFWSFTTQHLESSLVQGLLNLVFFLYLVRTDLREKMR